MDELIKFLTTKVGYILVGVLGFGLPGNMFVFVWNRNLYLDADIIKLLLLSFGISFVLFIPNIFLAIGWARMIELISKKESNMILASFIPLILTLLEMSAGMFIKILNPLYTIREFVVALAVIVFGGFWILGVINDICRWRQKKKKIK